MFLMAYIKEERDENKSEDETTERLLMTSTEKQEKGRRRAWFLDSRCSNHMTGDRELFLTMDEKFKHSVKLGNNKRMEVTGKGNVRLVLNEAAYVISDIYFVPELKQIS